MTDAQRQLAALVRQDSELRRILFTTINELIDAQGHEAAYVAGTWDDVLFARGGASALRDLKILLEREDRDARARQEHDRRAGHA